MPRIVDRSEKERILRAAIADELRRFHRNSCYPDPIDEEVAVAVATIMNAIDDSIF
jgi:hypothetical protein